MKAQNVEQVMLKGGYISSRRRVNEEDKRG
jgi:hypothetical protein